MIAAGVSAKMLRQLQQLGGSAGRMGELLHVLKREEEERGKKDSVAVEDGDRIEFANVEVVTPTGIVLVKDLSFVLDAGSSLLLTGHNGAGKVR